jgi:hypothetical protein
MQNMFRIAAVLAAFSLANSAEAQTVSMRSDDCAQLVRHAAAADVAFQPGVDLQGRFVVAADLGGSVQINPPTEFNIPITMDLQRRFGIPVDPTLFQTQNFSVGTVTWKHGRGYFNGQALQNDESEKLAALCQRHMKSGR